MAGETKFEGWCGLDEDSANGNMKWQTYAAKTWEETDVDIEISHCGVCGSDLHTLRSGWGETPYPAVVGHEVLFLSPLSLRPRTFYSNDMLTVVVLCLHPDCRQSHPCW